MTITDQITALLSADPICGGRVTGETVRAIAGLVAGWQPIESAPKDRTKIDLWMQNLDGEEYREANAYYTDDWSDEIVRYGADGSVKRDVIRRSGWVAPNHDYDGKDGLCDEPPWFNAHPKQNKWMGVVATHWMPIPPPPIERGDFGAGEG